MAGLSAASASLLLLGALAFSVNAKCRITAEWETEDHLTKLHVRPVTGSSFAGIFTTAGKDYNITGFQQDEDFPTFQFIIKSNAGDSVITYMGQCFNLDGEDRLKMVRVELDAIAYYSSEQKLRTSSLCMKRIFLV